MKTKLTLIFISFITAGLIVFALQSFSIKGSAAEPWKKEQLMNPAELAAIINDPTAEKPVIYSIGPGADIKGSIEMGAAQEKENLDKLKASLSNLDKNTAIILLCGCCPFEHCPNIRPAFKLMNEMKFTQHKLLNLTHNLKVDWIDKGYPMK